MNCAGCGAGMRLDGVRQAMVCDFCRRFEYPQPNADGVRVFESSAAASCPLCRGSMVQAAVGGAAIDYCKTCRGMLVETHAFVRSIENLRAEIGFTLVHEPAHPGDLHRRIGCPRCRRTMDTHYYAGPGNVVIDNCPECMVNFLDHNELRRIATGWRPKDPPQREVAVWIEEPDEANHAQYEAEGAVLKALLRLLLG